MIQDIAPKKYDNHYEEQNPADEDWMLVYKDGQILCRFDQEKIYFPKVKETGWKGKDVTYLFTISGERFFLLKEGNSFLFLLSKRAIICFKSFFSLRRQLSSVLSILFVSTIFIYSR